MTHKYVIFHCAKDDSWIVSVLAGDNYVNGVADCPNQETAHKVLEAMRLREEQKHE